MSFCRFRFVLSSFLQHPDLPFAEVLPEETIAQAFADAGVACPPKPAADDNIVYTATVTLWAFLSQVLHKQEQRSCVAAVARVVVLLALKQAKPRAILSAQRIVARGESFLRTPQWSLVQASA
jgi:hypothetical protein